MSATVDSYGNYLALGGVDQPDPLPPQVTFTSVVEGNPNTLGFTVSVFPALVFDSSNNVIYGTEDGSTWVAVSGGGGGGTTQVYRGHGAPVSTPTNPAVYYDLDSGDFYVWFTSNWEQLLNF